MLHSSISSTIVERGSGVWNKDQPLIFGSSFGIYSSHHRRRHHLNSPSRNSSPSGAPPLSWGMWARRRRWRRNHKGDPTSGRLTRCIDETHDENCGLFCSLSRFSPQITLFKSDNHIIAQTTTSTANSSQAVEPKIHRWFLFILPSTTAVTINDPNSIASPSPL